MDRVAYFRTLFGKRDQTLEAILRGSLLGENLTPMQVDDEGARVLQLLTLIHAPRLAIEVGTYFGYSAIHIGRGLPAGGRLTSIEVDPRLAEIARRNIDASGLSNSVDIVTSDACNYLSTLTPESIDLVFIDADKRVYPDLLRTVFGLLKPGGLLIADDCWADGDFSRDGISPLAGTEAELSINTYNRAVVRSPLFFSALFGTRNGLLVSRKVQTMASLVTSQSD